MLLATVGCGAELVRPRETTTAQAPARAECADVAAGAEPLVVDWRREQRAALEKAMKDGVAIVAYSCRGITLLSECKLDGKYGYIGTKRREQVLLLEGRDELQANLPLTGGQIGAGLEPGSPLEVGMIMVGKWQSTWSGPTNTDLKGECAGATHYVRAATVGAFTLARGRHRDARASAGKIENHDGDPAECAKSGSDADSPPAQCGAALRLALTPILSKTVDVAERDAPAPVAAEVRVGCPLGFVESGGKCTKPEAAMAFRCLAGDAQGCEQQCAKGHAGSCRELAELLARSVVPASAMAPAHKACEAGEARACTVLGQLLHSGAGGSQDDVGARKMFEKACAEGDGVGCTALGKSVAAVDPTRALALFERGCAGGDVVGCAAAGAQHLGSGAPGAKRDALKARDALARACEGGDGPSCATLGVLYDSGDPQLPRQPMLAETMLRRGCMRGSAEACGGLGMALASKQSDDTGQAKRYLERACLGGDVLACAALKVTFDDARSIAAGTKQRMALNSACMGGSARACAHVGLLDAAAGNPVAAKPPLQRACTMGDAWACLVHSKLAK
jgi:TPR repeat protein